MTFGALSARRGYPNRGRFAENARSSQRIKIRCEFNSALSTKALLNLEKFLHFIKTEFKKYSVKSLFRLALAK
jgi:hypothetical protein